MWDNYILYMAFLGQILVLSFYFPRKLLGLVNKSMQQHPRDTYPKLYPFEDGVIKEKLKLFSVFNTFVMVVGLSILAISIINSSEDLAGWDDQGVLVSYVMLQYLPMLYLGAQSFAYLKLMRKKSTHEHRSANLKPRKLLDFVSKTFLTTAISCYVLCVLTVLYFVQYPLMDLLV